MAAHSFLSILGGLVLLVLGAESLVRASVVGSNIFNLPASVGTSALLRPLATTGIAGLDDSAMIIAALVLLPLAWTHGRLVRWEGVLLLAGHGGYVSYRAGLWR